LLPFELVPPVPFAANPMAIKTQNFVRIHIVMRLHLRILSKTLSVIATFWKETALGAINRNGDMRHTANGC
jgi:hypothetical protein